VVQAPRGCWRAGHPSSERHMLSERQVMQVYQQGAVCMARPHRIQWRRAVICVSVEQAALLACTEERKRSTPDLAPCPAFELSWRFTPCTTHHLLQSRLSVTLLIPTRLKEVPDTEQSTLCLLYITTWQQRWTLPSAWTLPLTCLVRCRVRRSATPSCRRWRSPASPTCSSAHTRRRLCTFSYTLQSS